MPTACWFRQCAGRRHTCGRWRCGRLCVTFERVCSVQGDRGGRSQKVDGSGGAKPADGQGLWEQKHRHVACITMGKEGRSRSRSVARPVSAQLIEESCTPPEGCGPVDKILEEVDAQICLQRPRPRRGSGVTSISQEMVY